jgi:hypothetical protein
MMIGYYEDINGKNAVPLKDVEPTKAEILSIIKYHIEQIMTVKVCWDAGCSGSWEIRQFPYSNERLSYYGKFVGKEVIDKLIDDRMKEVKEGELKK